MTRSGRRVEVTVRKLRQLGDPLLRQRSDIVSDPSSFGVIALVNDLRDTLAHWRETTTYGRGIAAPQIGELQRVVFMNMSEPWTLINPEITERSEETMVVWDACLSFLCIFFQVTRNQWVTVRYQDLERHWHEVRAVGDLAELLQHEIDHLDGILALDRMTDISSMCVREEFEARYRAGSPYGRQ